MPAKLPSALIKQRKPTLEEMPPGSEAFLYRNWLEVDLDGTVYARRYATLELGAEGHVHVRRDGNGAYHLDLRGLLKQPVEASDLSRRKSEFISFESIEGLPEEH